VDTSSRRDVPHARPYTIAPACKNQASLRLLSYVDRKSSEIICTIRKNRNAPLPRSLRESPHQLNFARWIDGDGVPLTGSRRRRRRSG